jgi:beta-lactamase class A
MKGNRPMREARRASATWTCVLLLAVGIVSAIARADDVGEGEAITVPADKVQQHLKAMKLRPAGDDPAPIWNFANLELQNEVEQALKRLGLDQAVREKRLSVALMDITDIHNPALASLNGDKMFYAASLPKIAILLAAFEEIAAGKLELTPELDDLMKRMIRNSSNSAATEVMHRVGKERIAEVLTSSRYRLYDPQHGGGLWLGKDFAKKGLWRRDPINNLSHGATAMEVARFWYMLETDLLVTPEYSKKMREILGKTHLNHKFAKALMAIDPSAEIMRKSGSWRTFHADSALIRHGGFAYIIVGLSNDKNGSRWLGDIEREFDAVIAKRNAARKDPK